MPRSVTGRALADGGGGDAGGRRRRARRPASATSSGMPPGQVDEASRSLRSLRIRRLQLVPARACRRATSCRARSLLSRLPVARTPAGSASMVGSRSSRGGELLEGEGRDAGWRRGRRRRTPGSPASTVPSSSVRVAAMTPTSLNMAWPQSVSQPEKLILNLRGRRWASGWRRKCWKAASAHGLMSRASNGQAPARWQPMHVAHGVAAGLAGGEADRRQVAHDRRGSARGRRSGTGCSGGW